MAQCRSCQFHNMPGAAACGRCGASLLLAAAVINVYPPRAGKWAKTWRRLGIPRRVRIMNSRWTSAAQRIGLEPEARLPQIGILSRMIVPGWSQLYAGQRYLGISLLAAYAFCFLIAALFVGTEISSLMIAAFLMIHAASAYAIAHNSTNSRGGRLSRFLLGCGLIGACIYIPLYSWIGTVASPIVIRTNRLPLERGEVLVENTRAYRSASPRVGDIVVYDIPEARIRGVTQRGGNAIYLLRGQRLDRIVAGPHQTVLWEDQKLSVDGIPSTFMPLNPKVMPARINLTVPADRYLIFPSTEESVFDATVDDERLKRMILIPAGDIRGRIYWRSWPMNRMGPL